MNVQSCMYLTEEIKKIKKRQIPGSYSQWFSKPINVMSTIHTCSVQAIIDPILIPNIGLLYNILRCVFFDNQLFFSLKSLNHAIQNIYRKFYFIFTWKSWGIQVREALELLLRIVKYFVNNFWFPSMEFLFFFIFQAEATALLSLPMGAHVL